MPRSLSSCGSIMHLECFIVLFQVAECYCPARNMHLFDIETSAVLKVGRRRAVLCWDIVKRSKYCREKIYYKRYMHAGSAFIERLSIFAEGVRVRIIIMLMLLSSVALSAFLTISSVIPIIELSLSLTK